MNKEKNKVVATDPIPESCIVLPTGTLTSESNPITQKRDDSGIISSLMIKKPFFFALSREKQRRKIGLCQPLFVRIRAKSSLGV